MDASKRCLLYRVSLHRGMLKAGSRFPHLASLRTTARNAEGLLILRERPGKGSLSNRSRPKDDGNQARVRSEQFDPIRDRATW
jgi:hypothetical protein